MESVNPHSDFTLTSEEAVKLTWKLIDCVRGDIWFAHSLLTADPAHITALQTLIKRANSLRSNGLDEFQETIHRGIKLTDRRIRRCEPVCSPVNKFRVSVEQMIKVKNAADKTKQP